jgi:PAS domain S-box-containing protein
VALEYLLVHVGPDNLLEVLFASSADAIVVVDEHGAIELASAAVEHLFGYAPAELVGQPVEVLVPEAVRVAHVQHRAAFGNHPATRLMGAGLELYGRRREGTVFPVDVSLTPLRVDGRTRTAAFVRDATEQRRSEALMRRIIEITREVLAGADRYDVLTLICQDITTLVGADLAWVVLPAPEGERGGLRVEAAAGQVFDELIGAALDTESSLAGRAMRAGQPVLVPDMSADPSVVSPARQAGLGPGAYIPMAAQGRPIGALIVARRAGTRPFSPAEIAATEVFAAAAAIGLALGDARESVEELRIVTEHERIARDLHDTVIQRLFALGMRLQGFQRLANPKTADTISEAVRSIDEVIREIRETIFDLNRPPTASPDARLQVRAVVEESSESLGFVPRVSFRGPVEAAMTQSTLIQLLSVLRESLSNVVRHARASRVDVLVAATSETISLIVSDDGVGISDGPAAGHGLANIASRAAELGGECSITARRPTGTLVQWRVPTGGRQS